MFQSNTLDSESAAHTMPTQIRQLFEDQQARRWEAAQSSAAERLDLLRQLSESIKARRVLLAAALAQDLGKSRAQAENTELHPLLEEIRYARCHLANWMQPRWVSGVTALGGGRSAMRPEARGVTLILSPWNYPVNLSLTPLIGALAAGNTVILKPSEKAPATARALRELIAVTFRLAWSA